MIDTSGIDRDRCAVLLASMARVARIGIYSHHRYESVRRHEPRTNSKSKKGGCGMLTNKVQGTRRQEKHETSI
jgi:hypothetical protein